MTDQADFTVAPGRLIVRSLLRCGITNNELAEQTGISKRVVDGLIAGTEAIDREIAESLERVLGVDASFWLNAESIFRKRIEG